MLAVVCTVAAGVVGISYLGIRLFYPWFLDDVKYLSVLISALAKVSKMDKKRIYFIDVFEQRAKASPDKIMMLYQDRTYTYKDVNDQANRVARAATSLGLKGGDAIAMMIYNEPAFIWTLLGFLKINVRVSLINTNLRGKALQHSLTVVDVKMVIVGDDPKLTTAVAESLPDSQDISVYVQGSPKDPPPAGFKSFHEVANKMSPDDVGPSARADVDASSPAFYIFTSGTTGLPKAAIVSNRKVAVGGSMLTTVAGIQEGDTIYTAMPLYHSSALILGFCGAVYKGGTIAFARKFSKTNFIRDCKKHGATVMIYIGELCRYLLTTPPSDDDRSHSLRLALGNGLRQDIFREFKERYGIQHVAEFYAATEGNGGFVNTTGKIGSIGKSSPLLRKIAPHNFYKYDIENDEIVRDENGHCIPVAQGEPGLLLMQINKRQIFDGYKGRKELNESKLVRNVVKDGDLYFSSGDMMTFDEDYNLYFSDRIGDTFRWKGENVSTTEVSNMLTEVDFVVDACVYGVTVPGQEDGKAGMATLLVSLAQSTLDDNSLKILTKRCEDSLPVYARPLFLRVKKEGLEMTSTVKQNKVALKREGFDVKLVHDPLYYFDRVSGGYKPLDEDIFNKIANRDILF